MLPTEWEAVGRSDRRSVESPAMFPSAQTACALQSDREQEISESDRELEISESYCEQDIPGNHAERL